MDTSAIEANKRDVPYQSLLKMWLADKLEEVSKPSTRDGGNFRILNSAPTQYPLASTEQTKELTPTMAAPGFESLESRYSVHETIDRLEALVGSKGIKVFARLDQAAEAQAVGIPMRPMVLLIFGDPKTGSPLMDEYPSLAIDLPLKALAWKSAEGKVYLSFNSAHYLAERHQLAGKPFKAVEALIAQAASAGALSPE